MRSGPVRPIAWGLLARAAEGRDIEIITPPAPAEPKDIEGLEINPAPQPNRGPEPPGVPRPIPTIH